MSESAEGCLQDAQEGLAHIRSVVRVYGACIAGIVILCVAVILAPQVAPHLKRFWQPEQKRVEEQARKEALDKAPGSRQSWYGSEIATIISALLSFFGWHTLVGRFWKARKLTWRFRTHINRLSRAIALDPHDPHDSLHRDCQDLEKALEEV